MIQKIQVHALQDVSDTICTLSRNKYICEVKAVNKKFPNECDIDYFEISFWRNGEDERDGTEGQVNRMNNSKERIHDDCLEHENNIWDYVERLEDQRVKNYETGEIEDLNLIIPILNGISDEVERYREFIQEVKMNNNLNSF